MKSEAEEWAEQPPIKYDKGLKPRRKPRMKWVSILDPMEVGYSFILPPEAKPGARVSINNYGRSRRNKFVVEMLPDCRRRCFRVA